MEGLIPFSTTKCADANPSRFELPGYEKVQDDTNAQTGINYSLILFIAKYVNVIVEGLMLSRKMPVYELSPHCKSVLLATSTREMAPAATGAIPVPNVKVEVTAVPANSTPRPPLQSKTCPYCAKRGS